MRPGVHAGRRSLYPAAMGEVVNLNRVKKARAKAAAADVAVANRVKHGRSGAEKTNDRQAEARRQALLDGLQRGAPQAGDAQANDTQFPTETPRPPRPA
jgi:hypothetical protein